MQLTNIARDVGEDARSGRLYLPLDWLRSAGIDPVAWLAEPQFDQRVGRVIERLLRAADALYRRADAGLAELPARCRPGMYAARLLYAEIGLQLARQGYDSVNHRAVVPWQRKTRLLAAAVIAAQQGRSTHGGESLQEYTFFARRDAGLGRTCAYLCRACEHRRSGRVAYPIVRAARTARPSGLKMLVQRLRITARSAASETVVDTGPSQLESVLAKDFHEARARAAPANRQSAASANKKARRPGS